MRKTSIMTPDDFMKIADQYSNKNIILGKIKDTLNRHGVRFLEDTDSDSLYIQLPIKDNAGELKLFVTEEFITRMVTITFLYQIHFELLSETQMRTAAVLFATLNDISQFSFISFDPISNLYTAKYATSLSDMDHYDSSVIYQYYKELLLQGELMISTLNELATGEYEGYFGS